MATGQSKRKLRIAFIYMPINAIRPPVSSGLDASVDLATDELARGVARSHDVIAYCARRDGQQKVEHFDGSSTGGY